MKIYQRLFRKWRGLLTRIKNVRFHDLSGSPKEIELLSKVNGETENYSTSLIIGENGSSKSTILRAIVSAIFDNESDCKVEFLDGIVEPRRVICSTGSVSDRFPLPHYPFNKWNNKFANPNYIYLGQSTSPHVFTKRNPLEKIFVSMFGDDKLLRVQSHLFSVWHRNLKINPEINITFERRNLNKAKESLDVLGQLQRLSQGNDVNFKELPIAASKEMANWILDNFDYEEFNELDFFIKKRKRRFSVSIDEKGIVSDEISPKVAILGVILNLIRISDFFVKKQNTNKELSVLDLSSGEFYFYATQLGLGFGVEPNSIVLVDEPEISLHPKWQHELMDSIFAICDEWVKNGHLIVSTHSPLIVNSAKKGMNIIRLENDQFSIIESYSGMTVDEVLYQDFSLSSSRSPHVVKYLSNAIKLLERGKEKSKEFSDLVPELLKIQNSLSPEDELRNIISKIIN